MIEQHLFPVEPWRIRETRFDMELIAQAESLFTVSNGHIGLRGNLDEGDPHGVPGTYLNSFYELRALPYAEAGYGYPESGQTVVNVTNGKLIRLLVDDEPLDIRYGTLESHERVLDLRAGALIRSMEWVSPAGKRIRLRSTRMVSFSQRAIAAIEYEIEAVDNDVRLIVQSELVANEALPKHGGDPRVAAVLKNPLVAQERSVSERGATLLHMTRESELLVAAGMEHMVEGPGRVEVETDARKDWARTTIVSNLQAGDKLRVVKLLAYGWSSQRSEPALRDQVAAALTGARYSGFEGLMKEQRKYLDDFWDVADVEIDGDSEIQQAVRFGLFHVLQAGARAERRCIAGKGLTGPGYDGHTFWDTEAYVLPVLIHTLPQAAADALRWRQSTLDLAKERAETLNLAGATFPWRTIRGQECSGYWPAGTAAFHINADIAIAVQRYVDNTGDLQFEEQTGLELLVETARLWMSLGHHDAQGRWHIVGVTGPDEYTAVVRDNLFTNMAAAANLRGAAEAAHRHWDKATSMHVSNEETAAWRDAAKAAHIPYNEELGVHEQCEGFTSLPEWDFEASRNRYPLLLHAPYFELYRRQVIKQADLAMAMFWFGDQFTAEEKARNFDYYERRNVRDSSLSACIQAVLAAETGHLELAHDYAYEAALIDLRDIHHNSRDGLHMASLAGAWIALVAGFGGLRDYSNELSFDPHLPDGITRLSFGLRWRGARLRVEVTHDEVKYTLHDGPDGTMTFKHAGEDVTVTTKRALVRKNKKIKPLLPRPPQPVCREPVDRHGGSLAS
ncbi:MAG TPA: glycoside hydrolase family 65 protein [Frankiaceae bacterium]|nr:glycoside hydrolase family 65 protein [Frankiaceae bacterium]